MSPVRFPAFLFLLVASTHAALTAGQSSPQSPPYPHTADHDLTDHNVLDISRDVPSSVRAPSHAVVTAEQSYTKGPPYLPTTDHNVLDSSRDVPSSFRAPSHAVVTAEQSHTKGPPYLHTTDHNSTDHSHGVHSFPDAETRVDSAGSGGVVVLQYIRRMLGGRSQWDRGGNGTGRVVALLAGLPGVFRGLGGIAALGVSRSRSISGPGSAQGQDVAAILAELFSHPGSEHPPSWLEPPLQRERSPRAAQSASSREGDVQAELMAVLGEVVPDVLKGLDALPLADNTSAQDVITAIMADPNLTLAGRRVVTSLAQTLVPVTPRDQCAAHLHALGAGLQGRETWALEMLDAMGKPRAGILTGELTLFGDYDQCTGISHVNGSHTIEGQLCDLTLRGPDALKASKGSVANIDLHVCLPKSCDEQDLRRIFTQAVDELGSRIKRVDCFRTKDPSEDDIFICVVITIGFMSLLCVCGTAFGVFLDSRKEKTQVMNVKQKSQLETNGYVNGGFTIGTSAAENKTSEHVIKGQTNGSADNGDVRKINTGANKASSDAIAVEMPKAKGVSSNGQNGVKGGNMKIGTASLPIQPAPEEGLVSKLLLSFSVLKNGRKVLDCARNPADISCLHGIRVLSITWVVLSHTFLLLGPTQGNNKVVFTLLGYFTYSVIPGGFFAVDTFFVLSGLLTAYLFIKATRKTGLTVSGLVIYYVHRVWRLTPLYGFLVAFYMGVFPYLKTGPLQDRIGQDSVTVCRQYWHYNILYVNNVVSNPGSKMCFNWSWYLSNDMQFSFLAPICLIPWALRGRVRIVGFVLATCLILTHVITSGVLSYTHESSYFTGNKYSELIYIQPWCRVGPYAVGLLLGYMLHATRCRYTMSKLSAVLGWIVASGVALTLVYINYDNVNDLVHGANWKPASYATYEALAKVLWAGCVSWVIFACVTGYGGFVNVILSWGAWMPLSRLTYGVYLIHLVVLYVLAGNFKTPFYLDGWSATYLFLGVTVLSFLSAFACSMLIEAPTLGLEKIVLGKIFAKKK